MINANAVIVSNSVYTIEAFETYTAKFDIGFTLYHKTKDSIEDVTATPDVVYRDFANALQTLEDEKF